MCSTAMRRGEGCVLGMEARVWRRRLRVCALREVRGCLLSQLRVHCYEFRTGMRGACSLASRARRRAR
jgi:hypothetical protein